jgi:multidrug efflux system membrane fusion protein
VRPYRMIPRRALFVLALLVLLASAGHFFRESAAAPESSAKPGKPVPGRGAGPIPVVTAAIEKRDLPVTISVVGRAEAPQTVPIRSRIDGTVQAIRFTAGQDVRKGQVLVELDSRQIEAQLAQARANLARDQANLAKARADLARYVDLAAKRFVAQSAVDGYRAALEAAEASVAFDQAGVEFARVQLDHTRIRAPFDGTTGAVQVFAGGNVKANDTLIVTVNQLQPILVAFPVPEAQLSGLRELAAKGPVAVKGQPKDSGQAARDGQLVFIDNAIDPTTGTIVLKARFDNRAQPWTPGQFVNVSLVARVIRDAVTVPIEAIQMGPSGNIVFVVRDGKVEVRPVGRFTAAGPYAVLGDGFKPGEKLVVDGQLRLSGGATVRERGEGDKPIADTETDGLRGGAGKTPGAGQGGAGGGGERSVRKDPT